MLYTLAKWNYEPCAAIHLLNAIGRADCWGILLASEPLEQPAALDCRTCQHMNYWLMAPRLRRAFTSVFAVALWWRWSLSSDRYRQQRTGLYTLGHFRACNQINREARDRVPQLVTALSRRALIVDTLSSAAALPSAECCWLDSPFSRFSSVQFSSDHYWTWRSAFMLIEERRTLTEQK